MSHAPIHPRRGLSALKPGKFIAGVVAGAVVLGGAGIAFGAIPSSDGVINACVTNIGGIVRVIDPATHASCRRGEKPLTWNQTGPEGPQGVAGAQGAQGLQGPEGPQGPAGPAGPVAPVEPQPNTELVGRLSAPLVLGPAEVDVYGYDITYQPTNSGGPSSLRLYLGNDPDGLRLRHPTTTPMDVSLDVLLPDGRVALSFAIGGAQIGHIQDIAGVSQVEMTFASIRITDQFLDFAPTATATTVGALSVGTNQQLRLRSWFVNVFPGTGNAAIRADVTFSSDLDRVGALELHQLLANPPTSLNAVDYVPGTTTTNETMVVDGVLVNSIRIGATGAVDHPTPLLQVTGTFTTLTTTLGSTTTCFAYDTNTAC